MTGKQDAEPGPWFGKWAKVRDEIKLTVPDHIVAAAKFESHGRRRMAGSSWSLRLPGFSWDCFAATREEALAECWSAVLNDLANPDRGAALRTAWHEASTDYRIRASRVMAAADDLLAAAKAALDCLDNGTSGLVDRARTVSRLRSAIEKAMGKEASGS